MLHCLDNEKEREREREREREKERERESERERKRVRDRGRTYELPILRSLIPILENKMKYIKCVQINQYREKHSKDFDKKLSKCKILRTILQIYVF